MKTPHNLTIYHKSIVSGNESWTREEVYSVLWENRKAVNVIKSGLIEADSVAVYIPISNGEINLKSSDVLVKGIVTDEINTSFTISDLKAKYPDVVSVRSIDKFDYGSQRLRHLQIGAS